MITLVFNSIFRGLLGVVLMIGVFGVFKSEAIAQLAKSKISSSPVRAGASQIELKLARISRFSLAEQRADNATNLSLDSSGNLETSVNSAGQVGLPALEMPAVITATYVYFPLIRTEESPTGAPPALAAPTLLTPPEGSLENDPEFDWTDVTGATGYQFQLSTTSDFASLIFDQIVADSSFSFANTLNGRYFWRVNALNGPHRGPYSEVRSVRLVALTSPTLLAPSDGSSESLPTFDWTDVISATGYQIQLSANSTFTSLAINQQVGTSSFTLVNTLDGLYYWRVSALNGPFSGPYSAVRTVHLWPIGKPTLLAPAEGSAQAEPTFDWTDVINATAYQFQLSTTSAFTDLVISQPVTGSDYSFKSAQNGLFYWRVVATDGLEQGPFSEVRSVHLVDYDGDEDGDSLRNGWELHGYDANYDGTVDVELPSLGAHYLHKDIFVEMDYMNRVSATNGLAPNQAVMDRIFEIFANAPVPNPDGIDGIKMHLELDDLVVYQDNIPWDNGDVNDFYVLKDAYFDSKRAAVYHYMIWANRYGGHESTQPYAIGYSRRVPGEDFFVTLGSFENGAGGTDDHKVAAFVHELGHNLGLRHGGDQTHNYKPNQFSAMNYWWAVTGVEINGSYDVNYQPFSLPSLNEKKLDETVGLEGGGILAGYSTYYYCPGGSKKKVPADGPIDWNCDGDTSDTNVSVDINKDGDLNSLRSVNEWEQIVFHGGNVIGR